MAIAILLAGGVGIAGMLQRDRPKLERQATIAGLVLFFGTLLWAFIGSHISPAWAYRSSSVSQGSIAWYPAPAAISTISTRSSF